MGGPPFISTSTTRKPIKYVIFVIECHRCIVANGTVESHTFPFSSIFNFDFDVVVVPPVQGSTINSNRYDISVYVIFGFVFFFGRIVLFFRSVSRWFGASGFGITLPHRIPVVNMQCGVGGRECSTRVRDRNHCKIQIGGGSTLHSLLLAVPLCCNSHHSFDTKSG